MNLRVLAALIALGAASAAPAAQSTVTAAPLRVGAARVDYTPGAPLPGNFQGMLDRIYVRSIVLDNGRTRAALIAIVIASIR